MSTLRAARATDQPLGVGSAVRLQRVLILLKLARVYRARLERACRVTRVPSAQHIRLLRHDWGMPRPELDIDFNPAQARLMTRMGSG